jgi:hypothetical protein
MELVDLVAQRGQYWDTKEQKFVDEYNNNCSDILLPMAIWSAVWTTNVQSEGRNEKLLRIIRERANADRELRPKKEHTGYVITNFVEKTGRPSQSIPIFKWYETTIQSPFPVAETAFETAKSEVYRAIFADGIGAKIGIEGRGEDIPPEYGTEIFNYDMGKKNAVFGIKYRANCRDGYWEFTLQHSLPLTAFPVDMLPEKSKNVEKSRK